ncbi:3155_t:CDS:2, partial [Acaulospora colombiana]
SHPSSLHPLTKSHNPIWTDPDDETLRISIASDKRLRKLREDASEDVILGNEYEKRLRKQLETIVPVPKWAVSARRKRRREEMEEPDDHRVVIDNLVNSTAGIIDTARSDLPKGTIDIERLRDANQSSKTEGDVKAIMFHPSPVVSVMLAAGGDRRLKLFTIDGHTNPLLQTVHIPSLPISSAIYHPSGSHIVLTGQRPFFFKYDLQSGACIKSPRGFWGSFVNHPDN